MTADDVKELTELEVAIIATIKLAWQKRDLGAFGIVKAFFADEEILAKWKKGLEGCQEIPAEVSPLTVAKVLAIIQAAIPEVFA